MKREFERRLTENKWEVPRYGELFLDSKRVWYELRNLLTEEDI